MPKTLAEIFGVADGGAIPSDERGLRQSIAAADAERAKLMDELTRRKLSSAAGGSYDQRALTRAADEEIFKQIGRVEEARMDLDRRLQSLLQSRAMDEMHADAPETRAELAKLRAIRTAVIEKRTGPVDDETRRKLNLAISRREIWLEGAR